MIRLVIASVESNMGFFWMPLGCVGPISSSVGDRIYRIASPQIQMLSLEIWVVMVQRPPIPLGDIVAEIESILMWLKNTLLK
ncbi:hypothetical protein [Laspinema olomoucense]|uniref:hypothetical protein n=1 Tax=Laspinema olomoucense TaxID=3231600 RepID=UPI0021BB8FA8|nr:hypothetical protein [Laspinema sp. D3d]MCT7973407.1 hypothetical protein [Laspinema sp. D3d]